MDGPDLISAGGWSAVRHGGEVIAEVRPDPGADALAFRIPREHFDLDFDRQATTEDLLAAAGVPGDRVAEWRVGGESYPGQGGDNPELRRLLPPPPPGATHLTVHVRLTPAVAAAEDLTEEAWQALDGLWRAILGLEAGIDAARQSVDGLRAEMEAAHRRPLAAEEKVHPIQGDVAQWTQAKSRVHFAMPKAREFVHRATWAAAAAERKRLGELYEKHIEPRVPVPDVDREREKLDYLQKDRQVLLAQGTGVAQECRGILAEVQRALATLQRNAADRSRKERTAKRGGQGKYY